jgi:hypothetical protein
MSDEDVGYRRPPLSGRFRPGVSGNPRGRPKRQANSFARTIETTLDAPVSYQEGGRAKATTYRELSLRLLVNEAVNGDIAAAELIPKIIDRAERLGEAGGDKIIVENWLPDHPGQLAGQTNAGAEEDRDVPAPIDRSSES